MIRTKRKLDSVSQEHSLREGDGVAHDNNGNIMKESNSKKKPSSGGNRSRAQCQQNPKSAAGHPGTGSTNREREKTQRKKFASNSVNTAFTTLRSLIPTEPVDRKLSKIETLRLASSYISHLYSHVLEESPIDDGKDVGSDTTSDGGSSNPPQPTSKICTFCLSDSKKMQGRCNPSHNPQLQSHSAIPPPPSTDWYYNVQDHHHHPISTGIHHDLAMSGGINAYY